MAKSFVLSVGCCCYRGGRPWRFGRDGKPASEGLAWGREVSAGTFGGHSPSSGCSLHSPQSSLVQQRVPPLWKWTGKLLCMRSKRLPVAGIYVPPVLRKTSIWRWQSDRAWSHELGDHDYTLETNAALVLVSRHEPGSRRYSGVR